MATIGFVFNNSPYKGQNLETLYNMAIAALNKNHKVFIYLNYDGVYTPMKNQVPLKGSKNPRELISRLIEKGAEVFCSGIDVKTRGIDSSKFFVDGVKYGSLSDLSEAIAGADRLITL